MHYTGEPMRFVLVCATYTSFHVYHVMQSHLYLYSAFNNTNCVKATTQNGCAICMCLYVNKIL